MYICEIYHEHLEHPTIQIVSQSVKRHSDKWGTTTPSDPVIIVLIALLNNCTFCSAFLFAGTAHESTINIFHPSRPKGAHILDGRVCPMFSSHTSLHHTCSHTRRLAGSVARTHNTPAAVSFELMWPCRPRPGCGWCACGDDDGGCSDEMLRR